MVEDEMKNEMKSDKMKSDSHLLLPFFYGLAAYIGGMMR